MTGPTQLPLSEVTRRAISLLTRELGPTDAVRFVTQFTSGFGDYTAERVATFDGRTVADLAADIRATAARRRAQGGTGDPAAGDEAGG